MNIAVVGLGCKFPQANSVDSFWQLLLREHCAITERDCPLFEKLSSHLRMGGYIEHEDYDVRKLNISPREARHMDPQQRIMLEVTEQALGYSLINKSQLSDRRTGVFIGVMGSDWGRLTLSDMDKIDIHTGTGNGHCMIPNRISYLYNLKGPSIAIDTACSSSLVAIDLASKYLTFNEVDIALVGGVNAILSPSLNVFYQRAGLASKDARCKSFGSQADGIVRGEGAGLVILKRFQEAIKDNNKIYAILHSTVVNHNGKSNGLIAPNKWAQIEIIQSALNKAQLEADQLDYVEAHGTGTALGDPIEASALYEALSKHKKHPLTIGSVKSNLGHLEGAAGIASLIKVILAMQHATIPASLHFGTGNQYIDFDKLNLRVPTSAREWTAEKKYAGISSFGLGGTNAHIIISNDNAVTQDVFQLHDSDKGDANDDQILLDDLVTIISEITETPSHKITKTLHLINQLSIDSLMMAELKEKIENHFQLKRSIEFADILQLSTVDDLYRYVQKLKG